jgi:alpha-galactosidase
MPALASVQTDRFLVAAEGESGPFKITLSVRKKALGLELVNLVMESPTPARPTPIRLLWSYPLINTHLKWFPGCHTDRTLMPEWRSKRICASKNTNDAPVYALFDSSGRNRLTFALSDALSSVTLAAGAVEETAEAKCEATLFVDPYPPVTHYAAILWLDTRPLPYYESLAAVSDWWAAMPDATPSHVPDYAKLPMYSSWYSFHQRLEPEALEAQCRLAQPLGMQSVIVDDGWQTDDNSRGYAYCGDWEVTPRKFPDFAGHVGRVHEIGMKYILWFSVPFVGIHSRVYKRFADKVLDPAAKSGWFVLDPRFPEVREYLVSLYESFVTRYGLDGFKLDFVDTFELSAETRDTLGQGRDIDSVQLAVDKLLTDTMARLRAMNPEILIEFRQSYIGPLMRKYGNMFRSGDVPNDYHGNRINTLDIRLISGKTPAHSDMVMWHPQDAVESAAMQLIHTLFSVPQVSILLDRYPKDHIDMVRRYLSFWRSNRDVLLDGRLELFHPEMLYPSALAHNSDKMVAACFDPNVISIPHDIPPYLALVNGTFSDHVILDLAKNAGSRRLVVTDCTGKRVCRKAMAWRKAARNRDSARRHCGTHVASSTCGAKESAPRESLQGALPRKISLP